MTDNDKSNKEFRKIHAKIIKILRNSNFSDKQALSLLENICGQIEFSIKLGGGGNE